LRKHRWLQREMYFRWLRRQQIKRRYGLKDIKEVRRDMI
jgi:hypothetical protein